MEIRFCKNLYSDGWSKRKIASAKKKIRRNSPRLALFLITLPMGAEGILEIYWYPELLQPAYRKLQQELIVVGLAHSRQTAFELVKQIVEDVGVQDSSIPVKEFFKEREK
ncbi:MAG: hypothetical protein IJ801_09120 [Lachnospiraceae bacterium]|nr:hypothetical protein [Lachnospiraceae bacterium]